MRDAAPASNIINPVHLGPDVALDVVLRLEVIRQLGRIGAHHTETGDVDADSMRWVFGQIIKSAMEIEDLVNRFEVRRA